MARNIEKIGFGFDPNESKNYFLVIIPKNINAKVLIYERFEWGNPEEVEKLSGEFFLFDPPEQKIDQRFDRLKCELSRAKWKAGIPKTSKDKATKIAFNRLSYDDRLEYCLRPEETTLTEQSTWNEINKHLGTNANSLADLIKELGMRKFGYFPTVGDCFAGGGSIPFEAARIGLKTYASDFNPFAALLTWAGLNILSLPDDEIKKLREFQEKIFDEVLRQVEEWGIEKNEKGWMAKYYLYCNEITCPHCKMKVPLAPIVKLSII